jgi:hypothetical protein
MIPDGFTSKYKNVSKLDVVTYAYNPSIQEAVAGR